MNTAAQIPIYPHSGTCDNCGRDRDDLFFAEMAEAFYCVDVFRCEARLQILSSASSAHDRETG